MDSFLLHGRNMHKSKIETRVHSVQFLHVLSVSLFSMPHELVPVLDPKLFSPFSLVLLLQHQGKDV